MPDLCPYTDSLHRSRARRARRTLTRRARTGLLLSAVLAVGAAADSPAPAARAATAAVPAVKAVPAAQQTYREPGPWVRRNLPYGNLIADAARRNRVEVLLLAAVVAQESAFDASARSHAGAAGLTQLMGPTAAMLGVTNRFDARQSLDGGARYLAQLTGQFGDRTLVLAAYNAGPGAVTRYGNVPPFSETRAYVRGVLRFRARMFAKVQANRAW